MRRIKHWLYERVLSALLKDLLLTENKALREENERLETKLREKDAYIDGLMAGIRNQRRIVINTGEGKK